MPVKIVCHKTDFFFLVPISTVSEKHISPILLPTGVLINICYYCLVPSIFFIYHFKVLFKSLSNSFLHANRNRKDITNKALVSLNQRGNILG